MRTDTLIVPTSPREFYVWLYRWIVNTNERWKPGPNKWNAVYYQLMKLKYRDILKQPLPHTFTISRYKTVANLTPITPLAKDWAPEVLAEPAQLAIKLAVSASDKGIEVEIHCNDSMGVWLEDFVMEVESAQWSVLAAPMLPPPGEQTTVKENDPPTRRAPRIKAHADAIERLRVGENKTANLNKWRQEYTAETGVDPDTMNTGAAELYRGSVWRPFLNSGGKT